MPKRCNLQRTIMKINYMEDLYIPQAGEWSPQAAGDWMHPTYGPLPDHLGLLECGGKLFLGALWEQRYAVSVLLEQCRDGDTDPNTPMLSVREVYRLRGWIAQTYSWSVTDDGIIYDPHIVVPDTRYEDWRVKTYRTVLEESVKICVDSV